MVKQEIKVIKFKRIETISLNEAFLKTLHWFFAYPHLPISLTELSKEVEISKKTANLIVTTLVKEGFLIKEEVGKTWRITCNTKHPYNVSMKIGHNLSMIYSAGIIEKVFEIGINARAIVLFGSYRKGDDTDKSDIDIAVEIIGDDDLKIVNLGKIAKFGYRKNVPVNLHVFSRKKVDLNLFSNVVNGIVLDGFLEARP